MKFARVLDSGLHDVEDLKRKRPARCETYFTGATRVTLPLRATPSSSIRKPGKRRKLDSWKKSYRSCDFPSGERLLKYYSNFKKSGLPHRLMYYHNDEWNDFPQDIVTHLKSDLLAKKTAIEVDFEGDKTLLDFLHMTQMNLSTGMCQPIAWIDASGACFFPEVFADYDEANESDNECDDDPVAFEPLGSNEIKLHLEVEINGLDDRNLKESSGESKSIFEQVQACDYSAGRDEVSDSCAIGPKVQIDEKCGRDLHVEEDIDLSQRYLDFDNVKDLFFKGVRVSAQAKILEIHSCLSDAMEARYELFQKQVEITERSRGDANVHYAWLPCSKETVSSIISYGIGYYGPSKIEPSHGHGIYLIPANGTEISANYFDVDENDARHLVFCRVIMGNMELVRCGSNQFHPSSKDFDSGVDNLQNPEHYVIWNMNANSHIYPEYVISFKLASNIEGPLLGKECGIDVSGVTTCSEGPQVQGSHGDQVVAETSQTESVIRSGSARAPTSPFMPFAVLFAAISKVVPSNKMGIINTYYQLFRNKRISRVEFVMRLRCTVGDELLRCAIASIQCKESTILPKHV